LEATLGAANLHRLQGRIIDADWVDVVGTAADVTAKFVLQCTTEDEAKAVKEVYQRGIHKLIGKERFEKLVLPVFNQKKAEFEAAKQNVDPFSN
jgi:hypothetical protein